MLCKLSFATLAFNLLHALADGLKLRLDFLSVQILGKLFSHAQGICSSKRLLSISPARRPPEVRVGRQNRQTECEPSVVVQPRLVKRFFRRTALCWIGGN